jgi:hypothetical protein
VLLYRSSICVQIHDVHSCAFILTLGKDLLRSKAGCRSQSWDPATATLSGVQSGLTYKSVRSRSHEGVSQVRRLKAAKR